MKTLAQLQCRLCYKSNLVANVASLKQLELIHCNLIGLIYDMEGDDNLLTDENLKKVDQLIFAGKDLINQFSFIIYETATNSIEKEYRNWIGILDSDELDSIDNKIIDDVYDFRVKLNKILMDFE